MHPVVVHSKFFQSSQNSESNLFLQHRIVFFLFAIACPQVLVQYINGQYVSPFCTLSHPDGRIILS